MMAAVIVEDGKGVRPLSILFYFVFGLLSLVLLWFLVRNTQDQFASRLGKWAIRIGVVVLILIGWAGANGWLPGQVPIEVTSSDVQFAENVDAGMPDYADCHFGPSVFCHAIWREATRSRCAS